MSIGQFLLNKHSIKNRIVIHRIIRKILRKFNPVDTKQSTYAFPDDFTNQEKEIIQIVKPYTMTSYERLIALSRAIDYIEQNNLMGDIVECGVWRGGSMMLAALKLIELKNTSRNLYLFDTFEGMVEPSDVDKLALNEKNAKTLLQQQEKGDGNNIWCISSLEEVQKNLQSTQYPQNNIYYIKGKVEETLPYEGIKKIAVLRLDTDWYESTKHELETLFDKLEKGGVLIVDDYGHWTGAKKAVDEFIKKNKIKIFLNRIDYTGRIGIKM
jgi:hypothetical protein